MPATISAKARCTRPLAALFVLFTLATGGCGGIELSEVNSGGVVFSGEWLIDRENSDASPNFRRAARSGELSGDFEPPRREDGRISRRFRTGTGSGISFVAHDFQILNAEKMVIEQSSDSMGVRYTPGVYRDISWGERQRGLWKAYAGWEGEQVVVLSNAPDLKVLERFTLLSANRLLVQVEVDADGENYTVSRYFNRG